MFLLKFEIKNEGKTCLLHNGETFVGGETRIQAEMAMLENSAKTISVGGMDIVEYSPEELSEAIGGVPYKILVVHGGLIPFSAVEIIQEKKHGV